MSKLDKDDFDININDELLDMDIDFDDVDSNLTDNNISDLDDLDIDEENDIENTDINETEEETNIENTNASEEETNDDNTITDENVEENTIKNNKTSKKEKINGKEIEETSKIDLILYIIADKAQPGLTGYYRNYGVNVTKIFTNISEARDTLLMQIEPFRVIVIDSGTGRFTNIGSRRELIDLLGICDVDTRISVFYTDSAIKADVELSDEVEDKEISWYKYKSTPDVIAHILQNRDKENYIIDSDDYIEEEVDELILDIKGARVPVGKDTDLGLPGITPDDILYNMMENTSEEGIIPGYKIKLKR